MWNRFWNLLDHVFFGPVSRRDSFGGAVLRFLRYPFAILRDLIGGELNLRATGLVYATLLALIPALALSFAVLKAFGAYREFEPLVLEFFRPLGDSAPQITERLMQFAENVRAGLIGVVGLALLLWTLVGTVKKIEDSFNFVWRVQRARSLPRRITEYVALLIIGPLVVAAVIALSKLALDSVASHTPTQLAPGPALAHFLLGLAPSAIVALLFATMYMVLPNTRVRAWPALVGGLAAGIAWAATGKLFTTLVVYTSRLTLVYAGFAVVVALLLWTYFGWLILLAGAQLAFYVQNPNYLRLGHARLRLSHAEQERLALEVMLKVGRAHRDGVTPWNIEGLGRALGLPGIAVSDVVDKLEAAGIVVETDDGQLFPAKDTDGIPLEQIVDAVRLTGEGRLPDLRMSTPTVDVLQSRLDTAWRGACANQSLADLVDADRAATTEASPS